MKEANLEIKKRKKEGWKEVCFERKNTEWGKRIFKKIRKEYKIEKNETGETKRRKDF